MATDANKLDKRNIEDVLALTSTQEGMLYHYLSSEENGFYFQQLTLRLSGEMCLQSLTKAWNYVIETNEMLRTVFRWKKLEHPVQIVLAAIEVPMMTYDVSSYPAEDRERLAREIGERDRRTQIDLETRPFRITWCKLDDVRSEMIVTWHHLVYDGWSNGIILQEVMAAYDAFHSGQEPVKPRKTKFKEFIKCHQGQDKREQQVFWSECLKDAADRTSLPHVLEDRSETESGQAASHTAAFTASEVSAMTEFAASRQITPAALLYSAWAVLLHKYNRSGDIVFGTTVSGRVPDVDRVDEMVGLFINTIPLRVHFPDGGRAEELIRSVDGMLKKRERFENTPLPDIGRYSGMTGKDDYFDSIVVIENYPLDSSAKQGRDLKVDGYSMHETTHYALTLGIQTFGEWETEFAYHTKGFSKDAMERIAGHFKEVMRQMIRRPDVQVSDIGIVTERERHQLLSDFNRPIRKHGPELIHQMFEQQARQTPDHIAVICEGNKYSYREINEMANRLARRLREAGMAPDGLVALLMERSAYFIVAMLGVLKAGGAYIPIDHTFAAERIAYILRDSAAGIVLTRKGAADGLAFAGTVIHADDDLLRTGDSADLENVNVSEHLAYVIYTSGSTGNPKGVMAEHRNLLSYVQAFQDEFGLTAGDVVLQQASCSFDHFVEEAYPALLSGGTIVIANRMDVIDIDRLTALIEEHTISVVTVQPLLLNELNKRERLASVHTFISGGDVFKFEHFSNLVKYANVYNSYGPTESTVCATYYKCGTQMVKNIPIGSPITGYNVYVLDEGNRLMPIGIPGEICIAGSGVSRGYLNNPDLTERAFVANPFDSGTRMYRTGDIGVWQPDGRIRFVGRNDEQVKIRGYRIDPREIEHALLGHKAVGEAVVLPIDDASGTKCIAAYIKPADEIESYALREYLSGRLPHYMLPSYYYKIDEVPRTGNDKIDKKALMRSKERLNAGVLEEQFASETEHKIMAVWKEILQSDSVGLHDNFFDIGGNSILLMHMHAKLEKEYAWGTNIADLFSQSTISKLAGWVDAKDRAPLSERPAVAGYQPLPAAYFAHQPHASGVGVVRFHLQNGLPESLRQLAAESNVELVDVLVSMYGYLFTEISGSKTATLHCLSEDGGDVLPVRIDLAELQGFQELFRFVNGARSGSGSLEAYRFNGRDGLALDVTSKPKDAVLPFVYKGAGPGEVDRLLEVYDIALGIEGDGDGKRISFVGKFNGKRLDKEKMNTLFRSYGRLLTQLSQSRVYS